MKRGHRNTKLHMKMTTSKGNDLRRVFRRFSLRVNVLERVSFGPYKVSEVPLPGQLKEVQILPEFKHLMGLYYREKLKSSLDFWDSLSSQGPLKIAQKKAEEEDDNEARLITSKIIDSL